MTPLRTSRGASPEQEAGAQSASSPLSSPPVSAEVSSGVSSTPSPGGGAGSRAVAGMFARIVRWYDPLNRVFSLGLDRHWRACLAEALRPPLARAVLSGQTSSGRILDLAAGTLDVALALHQRYPESVIPALDLCLPMLRRGQSKLHGDAEAAIWPAAADACRLPLPDACVAGVSMAFGIRNIPRRDMAFAEMARVLVSGGRLGILEFGKPQNRLFSLVYRLYLHRLLPLAGRLCSGGSAYSYLASSIAAFPSAEALSEEIRAAGFARVYHLPLSGGIVNLHIGEKA